MNKIKLGDKLNVDSIIDYGNISNEKYVELLSNSIIFNDYYSMTAQNSILDAIAFNTPILTKYSKEAEVYLGKDYPFYFISLEDAVEKINNMDLILKTHLYLKKMNKIKFSYEYFILDIVKYLNC